jgi:glycosyltransferase involved in cell wall biosynthesis
MPATAEILAESQGISGVPPEDPRALAAGVLKVLAARGSICARPPAGFDWSNRAEAYSRILGRLASAYRKA